jgi:predicted nicotinamide N-methyase
VILCGDLVYSRDVAVRARAAVAAWTARGARVVLADGGRPFFDPCGKALVVERDVPVPRVVDGGTVRRVRLYA